VCFFENQIAEREAAGSDSGRDLAEIAEERADEQVERDVIVNRAVRYVRSILHGE
jgi:hypothetical protein